MVPMEDNTIITLISSSTESIPLVIVFCCCCIFLGYYSSVFSASLCSWKSSKIADPKQLGAQSLSTGEQLPSAPCIFPTINHEIEERKSGSSTSIMKVLSNQSELVLTSSSITGDSSFCGNTDGAPSPNLSLYPSSSGDESLHVASNSLLKEERPDRHDSELSIYHLKDELSGMATELTYSKLMISNLQTELSLLNDLNATMKRKIIELNDAVKAKEMYIEDMHHNIERLIHELTDDQPRDKRKSDPVKENSQNTIAESSKAYNDVSQMGEVELFCKLRNLALLGHHSIAQQNYDTIHTKKIESLREDLSSVQGNANHIENKNSDLQMQLTISSEKLHYMELAHQSEKLTFNTKVQEMQDNLHGREVEIAMLKSPAYDLKEDKLVSLRHLFMDREERLSLCFAEERSLLQQQLADALQSLENEKTVAATKLKESFDSLSRKEEEVKLVTKEFGLIQSELFLVMEQLNFEMKDMQENISSLREIVSEKDCIIQELQKHKSMRCRCANLLPYHKVDLNTESWEEVQSSRELAEFGAILLDSEIFPFFFDFPEKSSITTEKHISQGDKGNVPTHKSLKYDHVDRSNVSAMLDHPCLDSTNNVTEAATADDESERHDNVADFLFGRGTASLLRTSKKNRG